MKKVLSVLLALVLILAIPVSTMALKSSGGTEYHKVVINRTNTGESSEKAEIEIVVKGDTIDIIPEEPTSKDLTFTGISVYTDVDATKPAVIGKDVEIVSVKLPSGEVAVEGTDYKIEKNSGKIVSVNGELLTVEVKPLVDNLYVSESFKNAKGENVKEEFNGVVESEKSDPTADTYSVVVIAGLCFMIVAAGFVAVASKRTFG